MAGRKSLKEEIQVVKYMTELAGPTFSFLKQCITGEDKADKKWAVDQMMKLYPKALPNEISQDPDNPIFPIYGGVSVPKHDSDQKDLPTQETN